MDYSESLNEVRKERARQESSPISKGIQNPKGMSKAIKNLATPTGVFAALKHVDFLKDMPFIAAAMFALLKDILDFIFNETIILGMLFSILCSIFIFMMLWLAGSSRKQKRAKGFVKKAVILIGGGIADSLPGLGFLPIETLTVFLIYITVLSERASEK
ncbi:MAG TPA: hypothetical protein PLB52_01700 [Candidatus Moranbacteria bacterium]|nr:hypothetical protein [Candidatus Moranbacteria bacterium]